jgi:hypothetical protein
MHDGLLVTLLLLAAVVCFVIAAFGKWARAIPVGLACFAGAFLVDRLPALLR